jgi:hypothetical protein
MILIINLKKNLKFISYLLKYKKKSFFSFYSYIFKLFYNLFILKENLISYIIICKRK